MTQLKADALLRELNFNAVQIRRGPVRDESTSTRRDRGNWQSSEVNFKQRDQT